MLEQNKLNINLQNIYSKDKAEIPVDENVTIHTMQDDLNSLSGIFSKNENIASPNISKSENDFKREEKPKNEQYFNPFLDKQAAPMQERPVDFAGKNSVPDNIPMNTPTNIPTNAPLNIPAEKEIIAPSNFNDVSKPNLFASKAVWISIVSIIIVASFAGGYYFWIKREIPVVADKSQEETKPEEVKTEEPPEVKNIESIPKYLSDKPNFLPIDMENPSYENFKSLAVQAALEIKNSGVKEPVEFIITNNERIPVQFPIFKTLSGIKLSDNLMKTLGDDFSVFAFHEAENLRMSLSVKVVDQAKAVTLIEAEEPKLVTELSSLFFEGLALPKGKIEFKDNNYKGVNIRYFNLANDHSASVDYAFANGRLIIGTSKNSIWSAIDKVLDGGK